MPLWCKPASRALHNMRTASTPVRSRGINHSALKQAELPSWHIGIAHQRGSAPAVHGKRTWSQASNMIGPHGVNVARRTHAAVVAAVPSILTVVLC